MDQLLLWSSKFKYLTQEDLVKLVYILVCRWSSFRFLWHSAELRAKSNCTRQEVKLFAASTLEVFNNLSYIAMISLACQFEYFVNVLAFSRIASCIFILSLHINLNFKVPIVIQLDSLALLIIKAFFLNKSSEEFLWHILVCHCVPTHFEVVKMVFVV